METRKLIQLAFMAARQAYNPYSNFAVGAIVKTTDGLFYEGCNIENAAYGSTMCAERNAIYHAYSHGYRKEDIESLTIVAYGKGVISPCGACRQVLAELLLPTTPIILGNEETHIITTISALLPSAFLKEDLDV